MKKIINKVLILGMVGLLAGYVGYLVNAELTATPLLSQQITAGSLSITAPTSVSFGAKSYSFSGQSSTVNTLSNVLPGDERGSESDSWNVAATCADWTAGTIPMDYDGNGSTTGQLTIDSTSATCASTAGEDTTGMSIGATDSFGTSTSTITIVSVTTGYGDGTYDCDLWDLQQWIPASQNAGTYTTTLTLTIS